MKKKFGDGCVLLIFFPLGMTDSMQPIDAGYGCSLQCKIGNLLDNWLMDVDNLTKWEGKISASERRVLVSYFVGEANSSMLVDAMDNLSIGCFECTGCLIT